MIQGFRHKGLRLLFENDDWRVIFRFKDGHAYEVDMIDYH
jgi:plasmid maintenance system killer protein